MGVRGVPLSFHGGWVVGKRKSEELVFATVHFAYCARCSLQTGCQQSARLYRSMRPTTGLPTMHLLS